MYFELSHDDGRLINLFLSIETPCLGHIHSNPKKPNEPHCHALTTTAQLSYASPALLADSTKPNISLLQDMPGAMLDRLLNLSSALCSDEEVTPVQAWNYLRSQPHFDFLETQSLQTLANKLREAVKCHG